MSAIGAGWLYVGWGAVLFETYYGLMQHSPFEIKERLLKALDKEYNVVDMAAVLEIVTILERTPITKEALETTRLGRDINELRRKTRNETLAKRAKDLVRRWRDLILPQSDVPSSEATHQNGASRPAVVPTRTVRTHPPISPATSLPNSDKSSISPALSTRVEAVPRTHAANKRLRKEIHPPVPSEVKRSNDSSPELPSKRVKIETQSAETQDIKLRLNGDHYDSIGSDCEIVNFTPTLPKQKNRKKAPKDRTQKESTSDDIVKEKIALIARVPKVKTTQELLAGLQSRSNDTPENCVLPVVDHDVIKNKTEHIARFLRSQADNVEEIEEGRSPQESDNHSIAESDVEAQVTDPSKDPQPELRTSDEILSRLPPLDLDAIKWDETPVPSPEVKEITEDDVERVLNQHIEGINGNYDESGEVRVFREWHEVVSRTSYNSELIHILPYVVID